MKELILKINLEDINYIIIEDDINIDEGSITLYNEGSLLDRLYILDSTVKAILLKYEVNGCYIPNIYDCTEDEDIAKVNKYIGVAMNAAFSVVLKNLRID